MIPTEADNKIMTLVILMSNLEPAISASALYTSLLPSLSSKIRTSHLTHLLWSSLSTLVIIEAQGSFTGKAVGPEASD